MKSVKWPLIYIALGVLAGILILGGQWGAGVISLALTVGLSQLVKIRRVLETLTEVSTELGERSTAQDTA
ncbi:hypothetical protein [Deinococcus multiflagellatus]|uniref:Uncharacterized protein n=1 Tax=Deinococcus multiflagellatus TaxID=1656887 RepID=A0ABW1ZQB0_9DEIO|nr:hypothetical protein [Deinococcus multiflagellatus]MBZ9714973.1 hypothetical protein [Deinococcus multiflagellatus]